jgi:hypothetical protein
MTKTFYVLLISLLLAFVACGPSQEEKAAKEKATQDSLAMVAQTPPDFKVFFQTFLQSIKEGKGQEYINKDMGVYVYTNPGAFCSALKVSKIATMEGISEIPVANMFDRAPKGSFCEGYPGEKDGFFFSETTKEALPSYFDAETNADTKVVMPSNLKYKQFIKVNVIMDEYFKLDLYFVSIDSSWYLIAQSFCDCSA